MFQIVNPGNRIYTGVDDRIFHPSSKLAILDYDDLVVEVVDFSALTPNICSNIYKFDLVGPPNQLFIRINPYITIQNYNSYISWRGFRDNMAVKLKLNGTLSTLSMLELEGIPGQVGSDRCKYLILLNDTTILEFWCEAKRNCYLHPEYAFQVGDYVLFRLSVELGGTIKAFGGINVKTVSLVSLMFTLVFHNDIFLGCNTTYVHDDVSVEIKAPDQRGVVSKVALMTNNMY